MARKNPSKKFGKGKAQGNNESNSRMEKKFPPAGKRRMFKNPGGIYGHVVDATLNREGIHAWPKASLTESDLHGASIYLFKFILAKSDPRWRLASAYADLKKGVRMEPLNMENAMLATYASDYSGHRGKYSVYNSLEQVTQLSRAIKNIEMGSERARIFRERVTLKNGYELQFERTRSIQRGKDSRGVTGCPEALWQLQLYHNGNYLGRVGFNFHMEKDSAEHNIVTIANVQGVGGEFGRHRDVLKIKEVFRTDLGGLLCRKLTEILGDEFEYRGVLNKEQNVVQYAMAFRRAKIQVFRPRG